MGKFIWGAIVAFVVIGTIARVFLWIDMAVGISTVEPEEIAETVALLNVAFVIFFINLIFTVAGSWVLYGRVTLSKMFNLDEGTIRYLCLRGWQYTHPAYICLDEEGENARERRRKLLIVGFFGSCLIIIILTYIFGDIIDEIFP